MITLEDFSFSSEIPMSATSAIEYYIDNYCDGEIKASDDTSVEIAMDGVLYLVQYGDGDEEYEHTITFEIIGDDY